MDFGRVDDLSAVRFDLPSIDARSRALLTLGTPSIAVRAGAPAWASRAYVGKIYPKGTKPKDYLARYAERFAAIELNATFHRMPDEATIDAWRDATPPTFRFCPKIYKAISERLDAVEAARFASIVARFGERLGPMLLQLGPGVSPARANDLERFLDALAGRALAVELRHPAWFARGALADAAFERLASRGVIAVVTDTAGRRDACHGSLTATRAFVRFQGNELHPTDEARLDAWARRIAEWGRLGVEEVFFFIHQPDDALCPETLALFADRLARAGLATKAAAGLDPLFDRARG